MIKRIRKIKWGTITDNLFEHLGFGAFVSSIIYIIFKKITKNNVYDLVGALVFVAISSIAFSIINYSRESAGILIKDIFLTQAIFISQIFYKNFLSVEAPILGLLAFTLYVGYLIFMYRKLRGKRINPKKLKNTIKRSGRFLNNYVLIASLIVCITVPMVNLFVLRGSLTHGQSYCSDMDVESIRLDSKGYYDDYAIPKNIDNLKYVLSDDKYQQQTFEKKCEIIKSILYWEANRLGIGYFDVSFEYLRENVAAEYNNGTNTISINKTLLENGYNVEYIALACMHECRHIYQIELIKIWMRLTPQQRSLMVFDGLYVSEWHENLKNYIDIDTDSFGYETQIVEIDADMYALDEVDHLMDEVRINYYLTEYEEVENEE